MAAHGWIRDFIMPFLEANIEIPKRRPASYAHAVVLVGRVLMPPPLDLSTADATASTLRSCGRLLLSAQLGIAIESRRVLGHWGPRSAEPLSYDQSGCVRELAAKAYIADQIAVGWNPVLDFHVPVAPPTAPSGLVPVGTPPASSSQSVVQTGTVLECTQEAVLFHGPSSWKTFGCLGPGAPLVAASECESIDGFLMVPIQQMGAVQFSLCQTVRLDLCVPVHREHFEQDRSQTEAVIYVANSKPMKKGRASQYVSTKCEHRVQQCVAGALLGVHVPRLPFAAMVTNVWHASCH